MLHLTLRNKSARALLIISGVAAFLAISVRITRNYLADRATESVGAAELRRAVELDPSNAEFHLRLARLALYSVTDASPELAMEHLQHAARLSPRNVQVWLELSAAHGFQGNSSEAEAYLRRADSLAPRLPSIQWVVGNFFLLQGNVDDAFKHFRVALDGGSRYDRILFRTAWKASEDGEKILKELIPHRTATEFSYLYYLLSDDKLPEALAVWQRIATRAEKFDPARVRSFMDHLIRARRAADAAGVWNYLRAQGLIAPTYQPSAKNLIINGNFEEDILNTGFDWRIAKVEGVHAVPDESTFHSPSHALRIIFPGKANLAYSGVYQFVRVEPNRKYRLQAHVKTDGITTDSGPRLRVADAYTPADLLLFSEDITGTSVGWNLVSLEFTTGPQTELIIVSVARQPSRKLDNLIAGKVWLDDVGLAPAP